MHRQASEAQSTLARAHGTSSKMRSYFYPRERLTVERPNTIELVRCNMSSRAFSSSRAETAMARDGWLKRSQAFPLPLQRRGVRRAKAHVLSARSVPPPQRTATRRLTVRYALALTTIAVLGILGQIVVQGNIQQLSRDTHVIDVAALQRTLSERLSKAALAILDAPDSATQSTYVDELLNIVPQREQSHLALQQVDVTLS